jgi:peptide/nickel transport system permease protein
VIEAVFNLPGIGSALVYAVSERDYPVVEGAALVTAIIVVIINAVADVLYQFVDPRTRPTR